MVFSRGSRAPASYTCCRPSCSLWESYSAVSLNDRLRVERCTATVQVHKLQPKSDSIDVPVSSLYVARVLGVDPISQEDAASGRMAEGEGRSF